MEKIQSVKGMNDLPPASCEVWRRIESTLREVARQYGYLEIRTPLLEKTALFRQSIGDLTDIVAKEMYSFDDAGVDVSLRPEATAGTVRACVEHGWLHNQTQRLWYMGAMFRRERPQKGRFRQFHQFGIEAFGWRGPDIDAEIMRVGARIWQRLGVRGLTLQINTLGSVETRRKYREALHAYLSKHADALDADSRRRLESNPLRILDSKVERTQQLIQDAPSLHAYLDADARRHFDSLRDLLAQTGIAHEVNPKMVRGLDYYTGSVFEWVTESERAQNAVCAGGRYDNLVAARGGAPTPAIGFALGIERLAELVAPKPADAPDAYVIALSPAEAAAADQAAEQLRDAGLCAINDYVGEHAGGQLKKQMKRADASGAKTAVIIGEEEMRDASATLKALRGAPASGQARRVKLSELASACRTLDHP